MLIADDDLLMEAEALTLDLNSVFFSQLFQRFPGDCVIEDHL